MSYREYHCRWEFELKSSPEQIWPFIADTNRFNRDTGVPEIELEHADERMRNARRRVRLSIYGMPIEWEEQPFEWVRPISFGVERVYSKGPMARMRAQAELTPLPRGGTRLSYQVWAKPKNLIGAISIPLQLRFSTERSFRTVFNKYDEMALAGADAEVGRPAAVLSNVDRQRLVALRQKLITASSDTDVTTTERIVDRLVDFIERQDDFSLSRIRPYQLADDWQEPRRLVLETCLSATRVGLLDLQWDLICPLCRGPQVSSRSLDEITNKVHCSTCGIDFNVNFDRFVELTFRPNPVIRSFDAKDYCIGSPQRSPHVVAQQLLAAKEKRIVPLTLALGSYRVRTLELAGSQTLSVSSTGASSATIVISEQGLTDEPLDIAERFGLEVENRTDSEQLFIMEKTAWNDQAATAAEVTALQMFRDLFSTEALRPGEQISVGTLTVAFTDLRHSTQLYREIGDATAFGRVMNHFDVLKRIISKYNGAVVKTIGDAVMAVFRCPATALVAMLEAQQILASPEDGSAPLSLKAGLHSGPCITVTLNDRLDYFGSTVNLAARLEGLSCGTDVVISTAVYDDAEVRELLASASFEASEFRMALKGFEEEDFQLWRVMKR
jgi:class 3 adenylate cyclase